MIDWSPQWGLEALSGLTALLGVLISSRFALRRHGTYRSLDSADKKYRPARTRRRIAATFLFVQFTLLVACGYRLSAPLPPTYIPSLLRLVMSVAIIRTCLRNERDWTGEQDHPHTLVFGRHLD